MKKVVGLFLAFVIMIGLTSCGAKEVENIEITTSYVVPGKGTKEVKGLYTGATEKGEPIGEGTLEIRDPEGNWIYKGEFVDGNMNGNGSVTNMRMVLEITGVAKAEGLYSGQTNGFSPNGEGKFVVNNKDEEWSYVGAFVDGKPSGKGVCENVPIEILVNATKDKRQGIYSGDVIDSIPNGEGVFSAVNSSGVSYTYTGGFRDGLFNGYGSCSFDLPDDVPDEGQYTDGEFTPTDLEFLYCLGDLGEDGHFMLSDDAKSFLADHLDLFPASSAAVIPDELMGNYNFKQYSKSMKGVSTSIVHFTGKISQIIEGDVYQHTLTEMIVYDSDDNKAIIFYPASVDAYDGDRVSIYALPIAETTLTNVLGGKSSIIVFYASFVE